MVHEHGFAAGYDSVKRFYRRLRKSEPQVFARIETGPGEQLQADFFTGAPTLTKSGRHRRPLVFRAVLSYSRHSYKEAVWRQDLPTLSAASKTPSGSLAARWRRSGSTISSFDLLEDLAEAAATGQRRSCIAELTRVPLLIIEDLGLRKVPPSAAEDLLEVLHRRYQKTSTVISSRPLLRCPLTALKKREWPAGVWTVREAEVAYGALNPDEKSP